MSGERLARGVEQDPSPFTEDDARQLEEHGITLAEARRQYELLRSPDHFVELLRPCVPGDGIEQLDAAEVERLQKLAREAIAAGRLTKFVPASGAASRMFRELEHYRSLPVQPGRAEVEEQARAGAKEAGALLEFLDGLERMPFIDTLRRNLPADGETLESYQARGSYGPILEALLSERGMNAGRLPKGLLEFHRYEDGTRTAFAEQLFEAAALAADRQGVARAHFTVSPEHEAEFQAELERVRKAAEADGVKLEVTFSEQKPATDTIATDTRHRPFRVDGQLLFRPAGHGALIENLSDLDGDLVLIKNIDNVAPEPAKAPRYEWSRVLLGLLADVQAHAFEHIRSLEKGATKSTVDGALRFLREALDDELPPGVSGLEAERDGALAMLKRPMRVCGMVPNTGEPGGGPFFVRQTDGSPGQQIVEMAQIDSRRDDQAEIVKRSTHFNPVFLACALRTHDGEAFDLHDFVDPGAAIVTRKSAGGRELFALERPGLWNGAMAHWSTIFVEVPLEVFTPVKTVLDLLRPEHQLGPPEA